MVEQSAIGVLLNNCVIGMDCSRWWDDDVTVTISHRADPWELQVCSKPTINPPCVSYFLWSPDL